MKPSAFPGYHGSRFFPVLLFCLFLVFALASPALSAVEETGQAGEIRILLGFKQVATAADLDAVHSALEPLLDAVPAWEGPELMLPNVARIRLPDITDLARLRELLGALPFTSFVEEDHVTRASYTPNDPSYPEQWHLPSISAPQAWDATIGSTDVTIAIIDTGVDYNHQDLKDKCVAGYNYVDRNSDPMDDHGHGTHVAGIAAALGNNSTGVAGVDWKARIMPIKALDSRGSGYVSDVATSIRYAADHGAEVINMSLGTSEYSYTLEEAVNYAHNKGVIVVAASGNESSSVSYPAACNHVIAVGALESNDSLAYFSNRGQEQDLTAPGVSILSTLPGSYGKMSGTSMASPVVAGCASLVLAAHPGYSPNQVEQALKDTATDLGASGFDNNYGYGKVNVYAAVSGTQPEPEPEPEPEPIDWDPPEPGGETVWYLAEGYTGPGFQTYVLVQNPNSETASLRAEFVDPSGNYLEQYYSLKGGSRLTLNLNAIFPSRDVSTCVSSLNDVGIVVERSMYFNSAGRTDGHCTPGSPGLSTTWYFAEGYTGPGFDEYILVLNPWFTSNRMRLTLYDASGGEQAYDYWLMPASRMTLHINRLAPGKDVSAKVETAYGAVAERAMYFDYGGRNGGHCTLGSPSPSTTWFFAEGYTGPGFDEWLLLYNPSGSDRTATVTYRFPDGGQLQANYIVNAHTRYSVHVNLETPDREVAIKVSSGGDGLVAERAMYFVYQGRWDGGHCTEGARSPSERWDLAEGYTGDGFETWILIQNTSPYEAAEIRMACMGAAGITSTRTYQLKPGSRTTIYLNEMARAGDVCVSLYSANGVPVIVERAMYFDCGGIDGGSASMGCN
ncbi:MAG: S8 family peptidase [Actinomycetota bacterium]